MESTSERQRVGHGVGVVTVLTSHRILSISIGALLLAGCLTGRVVPFDPDAARRSAVEPHPMLAAARFTPAGATPIELTVERVDERHVVHRLETLSEGDNRQPGNRVTGRYYRAHRSGRRPLVVVLPIWGASDYPQHVTVRRLAEHRPALGFDLLMLDGERYLFDWGAMRRAETPTAFLTELDRSVRAFETTVRDVRRVLAWAAARPEVDSRRVGLVGFSIGAILAADVLALEPRLAAGVLVMGGGHLHEILGSCPRRPGRARRNMRQLTGWSKAEYVERIEPILSRVDPVYLAPAVDPSRLMLVDAGADSCIPRSGRDALWAALGQPERLTLPLNHRASFLTMTPLFGHSTTRRIVDFLDQALGQRETSTAVPVARAGLP